MKTDRWLELKALSNDDTLELAAELEEVLTEVERLEAEVEQLQAERNGHAITLATQRHVAELEAENERLRTALEDLLDSYMTNARTADGAAFAYPENVTAVKQARAALAQGERGL